jgi:ubiquinone/menaquinone biosynthesis C-methylase UbiE
MTQTQGSYKASEMPGGLDKELERLRHQALQLWPKEARVLTGFGLRDGQAVLEVGGGPGFITEQLLHLLPTSPITVVEIDPEMVAQARSYLGDQDGRLAIHEGSILDSGLPEQSFDFAYARFVFQHLPDPVGAARAILRLLKPGGKLVLLDPDDRQHLFDPPPSPEVAAIQERARQHQAAKGGNRYIGRHLVRILQQAGFVHCDLEVIADHSDIVGLEALGPRPTAEDLAPLIEAGLITEAERDLILADQERFYASDPVIMLQVFLAYGEKPGLAADSP